MKPQRRLLVGLALTACAGFIDAVGFIELGGYYTSFMSGNTTQLGTALLHAEPLLLPLGLVAMFFFGSVVGSLLALRGHRHGPSLVLGFVMLSLALALLLWTNGVPATLSMLVLALGAGAQNAALPFTGGARLGTTFVTGTLFAAGQDLAGAIFGVVPKWRWLQHLQVWAALLLGALVGALAYRQFGLPAILVPGAVYLALCVGFVMRSPVE